MRARDIINTPSTKPSRWHGIARETIPRFPAAIPGVFGRVTELEMRLEIQTEKAERQLRKVRQ